MNSPRETTMPGRSDTAARMAQVAGQPPRIGPLAEGPIGERALELLDTLRTVHEVADAGQVHPSFQTLFRHHDATQAYL